MFFVPESPKQVSIKDLMKVLAVFFPAVLSLYLILTVQEKEVYQDQIAPLPSRRIDLLEQQIAANKKAIVSSVVEEAKADFTAELDEPVPEEIAHPLKNGVAEKLLEFREDLADDIQGLKDMEMNQKVIGDFISDLRFKYADELFAPAYQQCPEHQEFVNILMRRLVEMHAWRRNNPDELPISAVSSYTEFRLVGQDIIVLMGRDSALRNWMKGFLDQQVVHPDVDLLVANMELMEAAASGLKNESDWPYICSQMRFLMERVLPEIPTARRGEIQRVKRFVQMYLE